MSKYDNRAYSVGKGKPPAGGFGRHRQPPLRAVADEEEARRGTAGFERGDARVQRRLGSGRLYRHARALGGDGLLHQQIDVLHRSAQHRHAPPARAREDQIDEQLEVRPVQLCDQRGAGINQRGVRRARRDDGGLLLAVQAAQHIVFSTDVADRAAIAGQLRQAAAQPRHGEQSALDVAVVPAAHDAPCAAAMRRRLQAAVDDLGFGKSPPELATRKRDPQRVRPPA